MLSKKLLQRRWVHSHEDDTDTDTVYRPADFDFPPSRGRRSIELKAGGVYAETVPGPTDKPTASQGTWKVGDGDVVSIVSASGGPVRSLKVKSLSNDRLVVSKK